MSPNLLNLSPQELSLALLCLSQEFQTLPQELKHLSHLDWLLLANLLATLSLERQYSPLH